MIIRYFQKRHVFLVSWIVLILIVPGSMLIAGCEGPGVNSNGSNNGVNNGNNNPSNSCNEVNTCNTYDVSPVDSNSTNSTTQQQPPSPKWNIVVNSVNSYVTYRGFQAPGGQYYLGVNATFINVSTSQQIHNGEPFDLKDCTGQQYFPVASITNPGQSNAVRAGEYIITDNAFLIPSTQSSFKLFFVDGNSNINQWKIGSC
jgi:hypothetical protein